MEVTRWQDQRLPNGDSLWQIDSVISNANDGFERQEICFKNILDTRLRSHSEGKKDHSAANAIAP